MKPVRVAQTFQGHCVLQTCSAAGAELYPLSSTAAAVAASAAVAVVVFPPAAVGTPPGTPWPW